MWNLHNNWGCSVKGWIPLQETSVTGYSKFTHLGGSVQRATFLINFTSALQREIIKSQEINPKKTKVIVASFGIFILMSLLLYHCTTYFHRKNCHICSKRRTMVQERFPLVSYFRILSHASFTEQHPSPTSKIRIFFLDRICFYDTSKKCQKTPQTLTDPCMLTILWKTGMQSAFSVVCSIETLLKSVSFFSDGPFDGKYKEESFLRVLWLHSSHLHVFQ